MPGLQVRDLVKGFGDQVVVDELSFDVADGEFFVLLGPSGCGKTTTLRIVCGLEQPDSGHVLIAGRDVTELPPRERNLGMVFQEYGLYPGMDVFDNMAYGLQARRQVPKDEIQRRVEAAAAELGLTELLREPITDLSGGEQQRIALGRAMVKDADAYLYDEPLSNLDPKLRHRVRRDIMAMHKDKGRPTVYVTHDQTEALALGDRIAVVHRGRIQQIAEPTELVDNPETTFVAGFIGSPPMNLLPGRVEDADGAGVVMAGGAALPVAPGLKPALHARATAEVVVGIRPDGFTLEPVDGPDGFSGRVENVEPLIGETVLWVRTAAADEPLAAVFADDGADALTPGDPIRLGVDGDRLRLFDPATGNVIGTGAGGTT